VRAFGDTQTELAKINQRPGVLIMSDQIRTAPGPIQDDLVSLIGWLIFIAVLMALVYAAEIS
jgi:hypothetical protein